MRRLVLLVGFGLVVGCAPGGGGGGSDRDGGLGGMLEPGGGGETPPTEAQVTEAIAEAMRFCYAKVIDLEPDIAAACDHMSPLAPVYEALEMPFSDAIAASGLMGRGAGFRLVRSAEDYRSNNPNVHVFACQQDPLGMSELNAFALANSVFMLDRLQYALFEGAVYWELLMRDAETDDPRGVDGGQLMVGLGQIFEAADRGEFWTQVTAEQASALIDEGGFAATTLMRALGFVLLHELAHVNLSHSMVNHGMRVGFENVLREAGIEATREQAVELNALFVDLKVATETQADVYAMTILQQQGSDALDAVRLFALGIAGLRLVTGLCDNTPTEEQQLECLLGDMPGATHPPLNVRFELAERILRDGEDLTHLLETGEALGFVQMQ